MKDFFWIIARAYKKFNTDRCPLLASALVHATAVSLFPLILGIISISLFFLGSSEGIVERITPILKQAFPIGIDELIKNILVVKQTSIVIALISFLGFLWSTSGIFLALESTLNVIWKVKKDRPFFRKSLFAMVSTFLTFFLLVGSVILTIWTNAIGTGRMTTFLPAFNIIFSICLVSLIYWRFPNRRVRVEEACFGAMFAAVFWEIAKIIFSIYVTKVVDYSKILGSLSVIVLFVVWIYYSAYIFLFGAELAYIYARRKLLKQARNTKF